jgi:hypothetical protein
MGWVKDEVDRVRKTRHRGAYSITAVVDRNELKLLEFWHKLIATIRSDVRELEESVPGTYIEVIVAEESLTIRRPRDMVAYLLELHLDPKHLLIKYCGIGSENAGTFQISEGGESCLVRGVRLVPITAEHAARELLQPIVELLAETA